MSEQLPFKEGFLNTKGGDIKKYKKKWIVIPGDRSVLLICAKEMHLDQGKITNVENIELVIPIHEGNLSVLKEKSKKEWPFTLEISNIGISQGFRGSYNPRTSNPHGTTLFEFYTETSDERNIWTETITAHLNANTVLKEKKKQAKPTTTASPTKAPPPAASNNNNLNVEVKPRSMSSADQLPSTIKEKDDKKDDKKKEKKKEKKDKKDKSEKSEKKRRSSVDATDPQQSSSKIPDDVRGSSCHHKFESHTFKAPVTCAVCSSGIFAGTSGQRCTVCSIAVHKKCQERLEAAVKAPVATDKEEKKSRRHSIQLDSSPDFSKQPPVDKEEMRNRRRSVAVTDPVKAGLTEFKDKNPTPAPVTPEEAEKRSKRRQQFLEQLNMKNFDMLQMKDPGGMDAQEKILRYRGHTMSSRVITRKPLAETFKEPIKRHDSADLSRTRDLFRKKRQQELQFERQIAINWAEFSDSLPAPRWDLQRKTSAFFKEMAKTNKKLNQDGNTMIEGLQKISKIAENRPEVPPPPPPPPTESKKVEKVSIFSFGPPVDYEDMFGDCSQPGLYIWLINKGKVEAVNSEEHGIFYNKDSYMVLYLVDENDTTDKKGNNVHLWVGSKTTTDKSAVAAIRTIELNKYIGDKAAHHREEEGFESALFKSYFPDFTVQEGGTESKFRNYNEDPISKIEKAPKIDARLYCVQWHSRDKHTTNVTQLETINTNLNVNYAFFLECPKEIYVWKGSKAENVLGFTALQMAQKVNNSLHNNDAKIIDLTPSSKAITPEIAEATEAFWKVLGGKLEEDQIAQDEIKYSQAYVMIQTFTNPETSKLELRTIDALEESGEDPQDDSPQEDQDNQDQQEQGGPPPPPPLTRSGFIKEKKPSKELLDPIHCCILDCFSEVFVWLGAKASTKEKVIARNCAEKLVEKGKEAEGRPPWTALHVIIDRPDISTINPLFVNKFDNWKLNEETQASLLLKQIKEAHESRVKGKSSKIAPSRASEIDDIIRLYETPANPEEALKKQIDWDLVGTNGKSELWILDKVTGPQFTKLTQVDRGQFFSADTFMILYTYYHRSAQAPKDPNMQNYDLKKAEEVSQRYVCYFWEGQDAGSQWYAAWSSGWVPILKKKLVENGGEPPRQIKIVQRLETKFFSSFFDSRVVVHKGKRKDYLAVPKKRQTKLHLYQVRNTASGMRATEISADASLLNTKDSFILCCRHYTEVSGAMNLIFQIFVWFGKNCPEYSEDSTYQDSPTMKIVDQLVEFYRQQNVTELQAQVTTLNEGGETPEFWDALGVVDATRLKYIDDEFHQMYPHARLFVTSVENGNLKIRELPEYTQNHLEQEYIYILDTGREIFLWVGSNCGEVHKNLSNTSVEKYLAHRQSQSDVPITFHRIQSGENLEPPEFIRHFYAWNFKEHLLDPRQRSYLRFLEKKKQEEQEQARLEAEQEKERQRLQALQEASHPAEEPLVWVEIPTVVGPQAWQVKESQAKGLKIIPAPSTPQVTAPETPSVSGPTPKTILVTQRPQPGWHSEEVDTVVGRSSWLVKSYSDQAASSEATPSPVEEPVAVPVVQHEEAPQVETPSTTDKAPLEPPVEVHVPAAAAKPTESEKPMSRGAKKKAKKKAAAKKPQTKEAPQPAPQQPAESSQAPVNEEDNTVKNDNAAPQPAVETTPVENTLTQSTPSEVVPEVLESAVEPPQEENNQISTSVAVEEPIPVIQQVEVPPQVETSPLPSEEPLQQPVTETAPVEPVSAPEPIPQVVSQPAKEPEKPAPAEGGKKKRKNKKKGKNTNNNAQQQQSSHSEPVVQPAAQQEASQVQDVINTAPAPEVVPTPQENQLEPAPEPVQPVAEPETPQAAAVETPVVTESTPEASQETSQESIPTEQPVVPVDTSQEVSESQPDSVQQAEPQQEPIDEATQAEQPTEAVPEQQPTEPSLTQQSEPQPPQPEQNQEPVAEVTQTEQQPTESSPTQQVDESPVAEQPQQQEEEIKEGVQTEPQILNAGEVPQNAEQATEESSNNVEDNSTEAKQVPEAQGVASPATGRKKKRKPKKKK